MLLLLLLLLLLLIFFSRFCFLEISPPYRITINDLKNTVTLAVFLLFFLYFTPSFFRSILVVPIKHGFCNISAVRSNSSFLIHFSNLFVTITAGNAPHIRSYSGPYFPAFALNTDWYFVSLLIQSKCGKMWARTTPNTDTFYAVYPQYSHRYSLNIQLFNFPHSCNFIFYLVIIYAFLFLFLLYTRVRWAQCVN